MRGALMICIVITLLVVGYLVIKRMGPDTSDKMSKPRAQQTIERAEDTAERANEKVKGLSERIKQAEQN